MRCSGLALVVVVMLAASAEAQTSRTGRAALVTTGL